MSEDAKINAAGYLLVITLFFGISLIAYEYEEYWASAFWFWMAAACKPVKTAEKKH